MDNNNNNNVAPRNKAFYLDQNDFLAEYLFNPNINDESDFTHLDKNLATTRLSSRYKEPEIARSMLRALHVLNNTRYFRNIVHQEPTGYETINIYRNVCSKCGSELYTEESSGVLNCCDLVMDRDLVEQDIPIYKNSVVSKSLFPRTYHNLKARFYSFTTTALARDGHLMRSATTTNFSQSQTVEDRTKVSSNPFGLVKKDNNKERY